MVHIYRASHKDTEFIPNYHNYPFLITNGHNVNVLGIGETDEIEIIEQEDGTIVLLSYNTGLGYAALAVFNSALEYINAIYLDQNRMIENDLLQYIEGGWLDDTLIDHMLNMAYNFPADFMTYPMNARIAST